MADENEKLDFPKLNWDLLEEGEEIPVQQEEKKEPEADVLFWPFINTEAVDSLEQALSKSTKKERAFDLTGLKSPVTILRARKIMRESDVGDELTFFHDDRISIEDFRMFAKEDKLSILFDGPSPDGKGFAFVFSVPESKNIRLCEI